MTHDVHIAKTKVGIRTFKIFYGVWIDGEFIGEYKTRKEAEEKAEGHIKYLDQLEKDVDNDLSIELEIKRSKRQC